MDEYNRPAFVLHDPPYAIPSQSDWIPVSAELTRAFFHRHRLSSTAVSKLVGISDRTLRKWLKRDTPLPYATWYVLLDKINRGEHHVYQQLEAAHEDDHDRG